MTQMFKMYCILYFIQIVKVDREKQQVCVDEIFDNITLEELREILPGHQPRYVIYCCKMEHGDGRVSFPMCFIYFTPRGNRNVIIYYLMLMLIVFCR